MAGKTLLTKSTFWLILGALTLPVGLSAIAQDSGSRGNDRPRLGGPRANDSGQDGQQRRFGGDRGGPGEGAQRGGNPFGRVIEELKLTEEQQTKVREIMHTQREKAQANREKNQSEIDKIDAQIKELVAKKRELMGGGPEDMLQSIRGVLNAEQQATLDTKVEEFKQRRQQGMRGPDGDRPQRGLRGDDGDRPQRPRRGNRGGDSGGGGGNDSGGEMLDL